MLEDALQMSIFHLFDLDVSVFAFLAKGTFLIVGKVEIDMSLCIIDILNTDTR